MSKNAIIVRHFRFPNIWAIMIATLIILYFILMFFRYKPFNYIGCFPCVVSNENNEERFYSSKAHIEKYVRTSEINAIRPYGFDGKCHKDDYLALKGKKLSYFPQNVGVYVEGTQNKLYEKIITQPNNADMKIDESRHSLFVEGTFIAIDSNKIVQRIFCVDANGGMSDK